ncbi:Gypsy retrotransposon integrase-like protein 1 [Rhodotorula kratochvilovae]
MQPATPLDLQHSSADAQKQGRQNRIIRCDATGGATGPEGATAEQPCTLCASQGVPCTFEQRPAKRPPPKGYVESLERRLEAMEGLLSNLSEKAGVAPTPAAPPPAPAPLAPPASLPPPVPAAPVPQLHTGGFYGAPQQPSTSHSPSQPASASSRAPTPPPTDLDAIHSLSERLDDLAIQADRYVGRESGLHLVESVHAYVGAPSPTEHTELPSLVDKLLQAEHGRRPESAVPLPPPELAQRLIDAFFLNGSESCLFLHRAYFDDCVRKGLVEKDKSFRGLYYSVCAIGARFVDDPRLDPPVEPVADDANQLRTARGYSYFWTAVIAEKDPFTPATLYDLQAGVLQVFWLMGATGFITTWTFVGFAVRRAVDVGAHREARTRWTLSPLQDQLRKRSFHMLCSFDRYISAALGRPVAIQDDDMDVSVPLEISDEDLTAWELATRAALARNEPPPPPPASVREGANSIWTSAVELHRIMGRALKLLYGLKRDKSHEQTVKSVAELDAALNAWLRSIPPKLVWNPATQSDDDLQGSAWFIATYFQTQILIHREFISPMRSRALGFSSLAICSNAARATANVLDTLRQRGLLEREWAWAPIAAVTSGLMLLLGVFANPPGPGAQRPTLTSSAASDVKRCINALDRLRRTSFVASGMHDGLCQLARVSASPPPTSAAASAGVSPTAAFKSSLKRAGPDDWTDGRSPADSARAEGSDKPSPPEAPDFAQQQQHAQQHASKTRRLDGAGGLPFSTQDLSCPTFNGRPTFLFGAACSSPAPAPAPPPPPPQQQQQQHAPAGLAYMPGFAGLTDSSFIDFINAPAASASTSAAAPSSTAPFDASSFLPPSTASFLPAPPPAPQQPQQPQPQPQSYPPASFFTTADFWSLPLDDPSAVPPAVNAATGELLSHLGLPAGFAAAPSAAVGGGGAGGEWGWGAQIGGGGGGFEYDATLFGGLSPFGGAPSAADPPRQGGAGGREPFATGSGL